MGDGVWELQVSIKASASEAEAEKGTRMVQALSARRPVRAAQGSLWLVTYADFESREGAVNALAKDLDQAADGEDWDAYLSIG
jgi:hypothetical protein